MVVYAVYRQLKRLRFDAVLNRVTCLLLIVLGFLLLLFWPWLGLLLVLVSLFQLIRLTWLRHQTPLTA